MKVENIKVELMFSTLTVQANKIIKDLETIDPTSETFATSLSNLITIFQILSGAAVKDKGDTDGDK
jgi:hypothetical protein